MGKGCNKLLLTTPKGKQTRNRLMTRTIGEPRAVLHLSLSRGGDKIEREKPRDSRYYELFCHF